VTDLFVASTHTPMLFFTSRGIVHKMKVWQLPLGSPTSKGKAMINLLPLEQGETVQVYLRTPEEESVWENLDLMFCTSHGSVRRNKMSDFANVRSNGLIAMKLGEGEKLVSVKICHEDEDILLASKKGKAMRFNVDDIRVFAGRASTGVRGMRLPKGDEIMSMSVLKRDADQMLLTVAENGYGKRTSSTEYRTTGRGGSGVINMDVTEKTGEVVSSFPVTDDHQIMLVTNGGTTIRTPIKDVRVVGRSTQGVKLFTVGKGEKVVSVAWLIEDHDDEADTVEGEAIENTVEPQTDDQSSEK
jgi:DNA gyrase subunit A